MADWDKWDGQSWYRNNKNRPSGVGTVSHARREKMRQKALAREAAEALAKRDQNQAAADAAAPAAADAAAPAATNAAAPAATPSTTESSTSSSSSSSMHVDAKRAKTEPEQSLDKRDGKLKDRITPHVTNFFRLRLSRESEKGRGSMRVMEGRWWYVCRYVCR